MTKTKPWAPYGWLHSCGELYYQLDHPVKCEHCSEKGSWLWYEREVDDDKENKKGD